MTVLLCTSAVLIVVGAARFAHLLALPDGANLGGLLAPYEARLDSDAKFVSFRYGGGDILRSQLASIACCLSLAVVFDRMVFAVLAAGSALGPSLFLRSRCRARVVRLEHQLDGWLMLLANALRATPSLGDAIVSTSVLTPGDFGEEVQVLVKELKLGVPVDRALQALSERTGSDIVSAAMTAIVVARRTGGDLPSALEDSATSLRETARLEGVLRTKTAEGRGQVLVLSIAPIMLCAVIRWLEPTWFDATLQHPVGRMLIVGCVLVWLVAALWARRIVEVPL